MRRRLPEVEGTSGTHRGDRHLDPGLLGEVGGGLEGECQPPRRDDFEVLAEGAFEDREAAADAKVDADVDDLAVRAREQPLTHEGRHGPRLEDLAGRPGDAPAQANLG